MDATEAPPVPGLTEFDASLHEHVSERAFTESVDVIERVEAGFHDKSNLSPETRMSITVDMTIDVCWAAFGPNSNLQGK